MLYFSVSLDSLLFLLFIQIFRKSLLVSIVVIERRKTKVVKAISLYSFFSRLLSSDRSMFDRNTHISKDFSLSQIRKVPICHLPFCIFFFKPTKKVKKIFHANERAQCARLFSLHIFFTLLFEFTMLSNYLLPFTHTNTHNSFNSCECYFPNHMVINI